MQYKFTIEGRLDGLNKFINANRSNPYMGNKLKQENEEKVIWAIKKQLKDLQIINPVILKYDFYEPNKRRDLDNISSMAHKVIQDALVKTGVLKNDGWNEIISYIDQFYLDKENPRIEVTIVEVGD